MHLVNILIMEVFYFKNKKTIMNNQINETKLIVITRSDISSGYQVVQSTHSIADFAFEFPEIFSKWKSESNSIICLSVKNEFELQKLYHKYKELTESVIFFEPDVDEFTSVCLYGAPKIRKSLSNLPLALKNKTNKNENV